jgi:hypothetical protein
MAIYIEGEEYIPLGNGILQNKNTRKKYYSKVIPIDAGYAFPISAAKKDPRSIILSRFVYKIWKLKIPEEYLSNLVRLKEDVFQSKLKKILEPEAFNLFNERLDYLLKGYAKFPKYRIVKKLKHAPINLERKKVL